MRRRPSREIVFSFDSFLDVVANVIGIILRLILVAWVGAKSYRVIVPTPPTPEPVPTVEVKEEPLPTLPEVTDPLQKELPRQRQLLQQAQVRLKQTRQQQQQQRQRNAETRQILLALTSKEKKLLGDLKAMEDTLTRQQQSTRKLENSLVQLQGTHRQLTEKLDAVRGKPLEKNVLRYRTPISQPLQTEEVMFELLKQRVTLIDLAVLLDDIRRGLPDKAKALRTTWKVSGVTPQVGAFCLRYSLERKRSILDLGLGGPDKEANFGYGLSSWEVVPLVPHRGEASQSALEPRSAFRRVIDHLDPNQTAVTLWVYPDSFALYRALRDYLHEKGLEVAARPLPEGAPIAASRHGTISRGQ